MSRCKAPCARLLTERGYNDHLSRQERLVVRGGGQPQLLCDLLAAGSKIYEYDGGLLHAKSLTLDGEITLIGSANMDRRSFDLNYENNILLFDPTLTAAMRERQQDYISRSRLSRSKWSRLGRSHDDYGTMA